MKSLLAFYYRLLNWLLVATVAILVVPWFGALIYLVVRPRGVTPEERELLGDGYDPAAVV